MTIQKFGRCWAFNHVQGRIESAVKALKTRCAQQELQEFRKSLSRLHNQNPRESLMGI